MIKVRNTLLTILSIFLVSPSAVMLANGFDTVEQYMREKYIRGTHNSTSVPATHEIFVKDFESNQLFVEFKKALQSGDGEAKRVFELILRDLRGCLTLEEAYYVRVVKQLRVVFVSIAVGSCFFGLRLNDGRLREICAALLATGLSGAIWPYSVIRSQMRVDDLEKRIEVWAKLMSSDTEVQSK